MVREPWKETDEHGTVHCAQIQTYGDTTHTFLDLSDYEGWFLPGYQKPMHKDPLLKSL